jgi:hypothetical protein
MRRLWFLALAPLLAGCGSEPYRTARVSGRITLNGQPLANAAIVFQPVAAGSDINPGPGSGAFTDADGRYSLKLTGKDTSGAVVGKHKVRITLVPTGDPNDDRPKSVKQLPAKYNAKTELERDVPPGGADAMDFTLTAP